METPDIENILEKKEWRVLKTSVLQQYSIDNFDSLLRYIKKGIYQKLSTEATQSFIISAQYKYTEYVMEKKILPNGIKSDYCEEVNFTIKTVNGNRQLIISSNITKNIINKKHQRIFDAMEDVFIFKNKPDTQRALSIAHFCPCKNYDTGWALSICLFEFTNFKPFETPMQSS